MKVLLCHTYYLQRGGEDLCFEEERDLLVQHGHDVVEYVRSNEAMTHMSALSAAATTLWNRAAARDIAHLIDDHRPQILHCTNSFPLLSPAIYYAARRRGVAVVQALQNYRLLCANGSFTREGRPCEECVARRVPWPAIVHRCYHDSASHSAAVVAMQLLHRALGTWRRKVDAFFAPTEFARQKLVAAGLPANRVHVKPNTVHPDPGIGCGSGGYMAFAARLAPEKGVTTVLEAWRRHAGLPPLVIVGDGPLAPLVARAAAEDPRITWRGRVPADEVQRIFGKARAVVMPSTWYETFGRTIAESLAGGTPVIASRLGAMAELIAHGRTGWLFTPGDADDLARHVERCNAMTDEQLSPMRAAARGEFERHFTPERNYDRLIEIYASALESAELRLHRRARHGAERPLGRGLARSTAGGRLPISRHEVEDSIA